MKSPDRLAFELGIPIHRLRRLCDNAARYYQRAQIPKELDDGTPRRLPSGEIEYRQIRISVGLLRHTQDRIKNTAT